MSYKPEITETAKEIAKLADPKEFIAEFNRQQQIRPTKKAAYIATEHIYKQLFGKTKYSSFSSFERVFYRDIQRRAKDRKAEIKSLTEKQKKNGCSKKVS